MENPGCPAIPFGSAVLRLLLVPGMKRFQYLLTLEKYPVDVMGNPAPEVIRVAPQTQKTLHSTLPTVCQVVCQMKGLMLISSKISYLSCLVAVQGLEPRTLRI